MEWTEYDYWWKTLSIAITNQLFISGTEMNSTAGLRFRSEINPELEKSFLSVRTQSRGIIKTSRNLKYATLCSKSRNYQNQSFVSESYLDFNFAYHSRSSIHFLQEFVRFHFQDLLASILEDLGRKCLILQKIVWILQVTWTKMPDLGRFLEENGWSWK